MTEPVVLVPLDGSEDALRALPIAKVLADLMGGDVRTLHATEETGREGKTAAALKLEPADLGGAALIVICARSADTQPADAIGAAALKVLNRARCPVVLVGPSQSPGGWDLRKILAPHDGSPTVSEALGPAIRLAREAGAELVVLQVACDERALETGSIAPPMYLDQVQHSWPAWSGEFLQRLASICPFDDVRVRLRVGHGEPADETLRVAGEESADLIVLAWKGRWDASHASTVQAVLRDAPCPIMVTRVRAF